MRATTQLGSRGQVTLPADVRKAMGLRPGDTLVVRLEEGRLVLEPAVVVPVEQYSDERVEEFARAAEMSAEEVAEAKRRWGV
jgi:antitoxin PrlF